MDRYFWIVPKSWADADQRISSNWLSFLHSPAWFTFSPKYIFFEKDACRMMLLSSELCMGCFFMQVKVQVELVEPPKYAVAGEKLTFAGYSG
jgi:hypothetical protein